MKKTSENCETIENKYARVAVQLFYLRVIYCFSLLKRDFCSIELTAILAAKFLVEQSSM